MRHIRNPFSALGLYALVLCLAGCAAIGQEKAVTPEDSLRYGQAVMTGVYKTLGDAAEQKTLPAPDARSYYDRLEDPKKALDAADVLCKGTTDCKLPSDTIGKVNIAVGVLTTIANELRARLPAAQTRALPAPR